MVTPIWDFNEFMSRDFQTIAMGLTPSGHLHLGFLSTLACALMYLKEHPTSRLVITNIENSLSARIEKYNGIPLRFQYIEEGDLIIPKDYTQLRKRNIAAKRVQGELNDLIWKLVHIFDERTEEEKKKTEQALIPPEHKKILKRKENQVFRFYGAHIHVYSFVDILKHDRTFRNHLLRFLADPAFAKVVGQLCGLRGNVFNFGNVVITNGKRYQPKAVQVPVRLYCPNCYSLCPGWAAIVFGHPKLHGPTFAARCLNTGNCPRADLKLYDNDYVLHDMKEALDLAEFHFMLDPMRDFFKPFHADCHIFGGDYFQLLYENSGARAIEKIAGMFQYIEGQTGQQKCLFGGPLITMNGMKMSKSGTSLNLKDIDKIKPVFLRIVERLEEARTKSFPQGLQIEYTEIIRNAA